MNSNTPQGIPVNDSFDSNSKEYKLSIAVAGTLRDRTNQALGDILTMIEFAYGDSEPGKAETFKQLAKDCFWRMMDANQHTVYYGFGIEPYQIGDSFRIRDVLDGKDVGLSNVKPIALPESDRVITQTFSHEDL